MIGWILAAILPRQCRQIWWRYLQGVGCWAASLAIIAVTDGAIGGVHLLARSKRGRLNRNMLNLFLLSKHGRTKYQSKEWKNAANEHCILLPLQNWVRYLSFTSRDSCGESLVFRYLHYPLLWTRGYRFLAEAMTNSCLKPQSARSWTQPLGRCGRSQ